MSNAPKFLEFFVLKLNLMFIVIFLDGVAKMECAARSC